MKAYPSSEHVPVGGAEFRVFHNNEERALYRRLVALPRVGSRTAFAVVRSCRPGARKHAYSRRDQSNILRALRLLEESEAKSADGADPKQVDAHNRDVIASRSCVNGS